MSSRLKQSDFIGVWQRESLSVEKGEAYEDSNVLWLLAGDYYADLRWPKPGEDQVEPSAFAGRAYWNSPRMQFDHEIDMTNEFSQDVGTLVLSNGKLIEHGEIVIEGNTIRFEEVWVQLDKSETHNCQVARKSGKNSFGYIVRVSRYAIAMEETGDSFNAGAWKYENNGWASLFGIGSSDFLASMLLSLNTKSLPLYWQIII